MSNRGKTLLARVMLLQPSLEIGLVVLCCLPCATSQCQQPISHTRSKSFQQFDDDIDTVRKQLHIPGMAAAIVVGDRVVWEENYGLADVQNGVPVHASTEFCIASVSKTMAAAIVMQLRQAGKLQIDDPISKYIPDSGMPENITIREIMSHTSDGTPGEEFLYNGARYAVLSRVIEKVTGEPYATVVSNRILRPLKMKRTIPGLDAPGFQEPQRELAKPYRFDLSSPTGIQAGDVPPPTLFSAATGIISNVNDMARYAVALEGSELVNEESKTLMFTPTRSLKGEDLPYGLGWFVQNYLGQEIVWHYGQADSYASLFVRIPKAKLTLIVLANSGAMSDAFRLLDGNAMRSLLALDFLKDVVLRDRSTEPSVRNRFELDEEIDQALVRIYLGERDQALPYARMAFASGILPSPPDLTTLYLLTRLHDRSLNQTTEAIGMELIQQHLRLSPALFYLAIYYERNGEPEKAMPLFERIAEIRPPLLHWTSSSALLELGRWYADRNPPEARKYLERVVDSGDNSSGAVDEAKEMLRRVPKQ